MQCIGLRELNINLNDRTLCSIPYSAAAGFDLVRLYDMKDLLKFRDIVKLEIIATESLKQQFSEIGMDPFEAALQVLKQPRKPAQLKRQEKKDYPSQKATRATFGKTNFTTRMDKTQSRPASYVSNRYVRYILWLQNTDRAYRKGYSRDCSSSVPCSTLD